MAHEIEHRNGKWSFAFTGARENIWHRLGTQAEPHWTREDWVKAAGHDFEVKKVPLVGVLGDDGKVAVDTHELLIRTDTNEALSVVTEQWSPAQNAQAHDVAEPFIKAGFAAYDTAGTLYNGGRCFVLLKTKEGFSLPGGDETDLYVLIQVSHQYGIADMCFPTSERVVCKNTLNIAIERAIRQGKLNQGKFVHAGGKGFDTEQASAMIEAYRAGLAQYADKAHFLVSKRVAPEAAKEFIVKVYDLEELKDGTSEQKDRRKIFNDKVVSNLLEAVERQPGADLSAGSWWQAFHSVTWWEDHGRYQDEPEKAKFAARYEGVSAARKDKALRLAVQYAQAA